MAAFDWGGRSTAAPATIACTDELGGLSAALPVVMDDTRMSNPILTLELRRKRDVLWARHHARQLAGLLGFEPLDKMVLAAAVFEVAWKAFHGASQNPLVFAIEEDCLVVSGGAGVRLQKPLPTRGAGLAVDDVPWAVEELAQLDRQDLFAEAHQQNQEMLGLLHEVMTQRAAETPAPAKPDAPSSAA